jgi:hypothetical protein
MLVVLQLPILRKKYQLTELLFIYCLSKYLSTRVSSLCFKVAIWFVDAAETFHTKKTVAAEYLSPRVLSYTSLSHFELCSKFALGGSAPDWLSRPGVNIRMHPLTSSSFIIRPVIPAWPNSVFSYAIRSLKMTNTLGGGVQSTSQKAFR